MRKNTIRKSITLFSVLCLGTPVSTWAIDTNTENSEESKDESVITESTKTLDSLTNISLSDSNTIEPTTETTVSETVPSKTSETTDSSDRIKESANNDLQKNDQLLSEWKVQEFSDSYRIIGYTGKQTDLIIPNEINGKPTYISLSLFNPDIGKDKITSLAFSNENGKKVIFTDVGVGQTALRLNKYTNLQSFDGTGLDISDARGDISYLFKDLTNLTSVDISNWPGTKNMNYLFSGCSNLTTVSMPETSQVKLMARLFNGCSSLTNLDVGHFDTSNVEDMSYMFAGCSKLTSLDLSHFNTSSVKNMQNMFGNCRGLTNLNVSNFDTSNVTNMAYMFNNLSSLTSLDVSKFNTENVTNMTYMFNGCSNLTSLNVTNFRTPLVDNMARMFNGCSKITDLDVTNFNTKKVTSMEYMFGNITMPVLDLRSFNASIANIGLMFNASSPTVLFVLTDDAKLKSYDYASSNRLVGGPKFKANGGKFDNQQTTKTYFDSCAISPTDPKLQLATFQKFKQDLKPTRDSYLFESWNLTEGNEPISNTDLFKSATYTAQWTPSLENGNIPSQDVDNVKPGTTSIYGIAYMPKAFTIPSTKLTDETTQTIPINLTNSYHVAVRDQRMTQGDWTLKAQLVWDNNALPGSSIQTGNGEGVIKKNNNNGLTDFQASDLVENDGTVTGVANVKIGTTPTTIMTGQNVSHNGVYDYDLGKMSLILENANTIQAGTYTGNINWNLTSAP